jgi:hypothetical protein
MNHYNNNDSGGEWEFQWVEDSLKLTGAVFLRGLIGLSCAVGCVCGTIAAAIKETTRKS